MRAMEDIHRSNARIRGYASFGRNSPTTADRPTDRLTGTHRSVFASPNQIGVEWNVYRARDRYRLL